MNVWKLGTIWGTDAPDFYDFIRSNGIVLSHLNDGSPKRDDFVFVAKGYDIKAIARLLEDAIPVTSKPEFERDFAALEIDYDPNVLFAKADWIELETQDHLWYEYRKGISRINKPEIVDAGIRLFKKYKMLQNQDLLVDLLENKHQIILQGPPGTGKTRLAKQIAKSIAAEKTSIVVDKSTVINLLPTGAVLKTLKDGNSFRVLSLDDSIRIKLLSSNTDYTVSFQRVLDCLKNNDLENPAQNDYTKNVGPYILSIADFVRSELTNERIKLIQFHPAYSYEDFVRGISAKSNTAGNVEYRTENRVLGKLAMEAQANYVDSDKDMATVVKERWLGDRLGDFRDQVEQILETSGKYPLSNSCYISEIGENSFTYTGDNWNSKFYITFDELIKLYNLGITERKEIKSEQTLRGSTRQHATYYFKLLQDFRSMAEQSKNAYEPDQPIVKHKYVLIIDEINRANLPAVLGELIYALEYRGEKVDGLYELNGDNSFVLPKNLYIIGTMNTADRSVSHIDYAIRRRFAFVSVFPSEEVIDQVVADKVMAAKAKNLFQEIAALFTKEYLSAEFHPKDVQIGHSYFLVDSDKQLSQRLEFEIKPILREYLKDGILMENARQIIESLNG